MRRRLTAAVVVYVLWAIPSIGVADTLREARWAKVDTGQALPADLTAPEGKSRWDLTSIEVEQTWLRTLVAEQDGTGVRLLDRSLHDESAPIESVLYDDRDSGRSAGRWLFPDRDPTLLSPEHSERYVLEETDDERISRLWIEARRVGVGWLHLPSGPHEAVLQWAVIYRERADGGGFEPETVLHRWVDPREGVVAEVWGPASSDGISRLEIAGAAIVEETLSGRQTLRIYADELDRAPHVRLAYGYDRGDDTAVSSVTSVAHTTIGDLITAASWDFSVNTSANAVAEIASTSSEVNADETCSYNQCGFNRPGVKLGREDKNFDDAANADITTTVQEREDRAEDVTFWLRAGVNKEGQSGGLGDGENRFCYVDDGRPEVPLWRFSHYDGAVDDYYAQVGDVWEQETAFDNEIVIFNHVCPDSCGAISCQICARSCDDGAFAGKFSSAIVGEGPVTLPSGHTFQALLVRNVAEFCVYAFFCSIRSSDVRTVTYLWEVPRLGTVARLVSAQEAPDFTSYTTLAETDIKYGIFPPLSITASNATSSTIDISWDPGLETSRITAYKIYWDTDSGLDSDYSNSVVQPVASGNTVTIGPLLADTEYFFTVTALSDYANPATGVTRTYESVRFPTTVPASPNPLPVEVSAMTGSSSCIPTEAVTGVALNRVEGDIEICWTAATDSCLDGYQVLDAATPELPGNFTLVQEVEPATTCHVVTPGELDTFVQVRIKGTGGNGP